MHKWHHYLPLDDRYFGDYRNAARPVRMLEIGTAEGGSLELWRGYFGADATIFGIDINPQSATGNGETGNQIRIGSQADPDFLVSVVTEMGGVDIILDDGSHMASDIRTSFNVLFPLLSENGLYVVEDVHTSYWRNFGGGYFAKRSFIGMCKQIIDDMHHWYHPNGQKISAGKNWIAGLHVHDSIVFIEKALNKRPLHSHRGGRRPRGN